MFDLCSQNLLANEERFAARDGHRFVEMWDCGQEGDIHYRSGGLKEKEIASWLQEERCASGPVQSGLRVLLSPKPSGSTQPFSGKLPYTRTTYLELARAWRLPSTFLRAVSQKLPIVTQCAVAPVPSQSAPEPVVVGCEGTGSLIGDQAKCLLVRGKVDWTWDYTMLVTHDPAARMTNVTIAGLTATEIDLVVSYLSNIATTSSAPNMATHRALLPIILLDLAADETSSLLKLRTKMLSQIQQRTGMDRFNSLKSFAGNGERRKSVSEERKGLDLDAVMLRLTCLSDWVAAQRGFIGIQERVVELLQGVLDVEEEDSHEGTVDMFGERLSFVRETLRAAEQQCQYLERSIGAQVQTIYSLIAQKDNRLNHSATRASCQIASDSRRIAILTRRDSTDMRIIAAVTLIFLPGTFVATIFSTGLFDWGSGDPTPAGNDDTENSGGGPLVSKYLWVYFMLTGVLTAVVLIGWGVFSYVQKGKMTRLLSMDEEWGSMDGGDDGEGWNVDMRRETGRTLVDGGGVGESLRKRVQEVLEGWRWSRSSRRSERIEEEIKVA